MSQHEAHSARSGLNKKKLWIAFLLTSIYLVVEVIGGLITGSLALLSDAAHMLTDASALAISLTAMHLATRPVNTKKTYGYYRFEILAAAFNALMLFFVAIYVLYEAYQRYFEPASIQSVGMFIIATIGLIINLISMWLLSTAKEKSLNIKSAYLEVLSDMLGSIGVIVGAVIIYYTGFVWVDTVIAVAIGLWVLPRTWILLKETTNILLEGVPEGMDIDDIQADMCKIPGIMSVHDFHLWALTSDKHSLTAHVVYNPDFDHEKQLLPALKKMLSKQYELDHTTFQFETTPCSKGHQL